MNASGSNAVLSFLLALGAAGIACSPAPLAPGPPAASSGASPDAAPPPAPVARRVQVQVLAINDLHGNLELPSGSNGVVLAAPGDPLAGAVGARPTDAGVTLVPAGGAAYLAALITQLRAANPFTVVVSAGDLTGASPLVSELFRDEPTILVMNRMGLGLEAVGNHDFDRGIPELMRLQRPGCSLGDCDAGAFPGASFEYLAANVIDTRTGRTLLPPYAIRELGGARVAFIGETLRQTASVTRASAVAELSFLDEATAANALVPELQRQGASAIVLLLHQGGKQSPGGTYDGCEGFSGDLLPILDRLSPAIQVVVSAHTHEAYDCTIGGRLVTSAASYGRLVTQIELTLDPVAHALVDLRARNVPVTHDRAPDQEVARLVKEYADRTRGVTARVVGYVKSDLTGNAEAARSPSCETPLGDVIADAMRESSGADVAFMNAGGIRADLVAKHPGRADFAVSYGDAFSVQPFGNTLVTMTLRGAQIQALLEQQFGSRQEPRVLQVSRGLSYRYSYDRATKRGVVSALRLAGRPVDPTRPYSVTVPEFLASGGDGFTVLREGSDLRQGASDLDALVTYLGKASSATAPLAPAKGSRIQGDGCCP